MAFLNVPLKSIQATITAVLGTASMPWYNPTGFPVIPPNPTPPPVNKDFKWRITMSISNQTQSAYNTRAPGVYNGQDVTVGQWIANLTTGQAWQIITIESKTTTTVTAIIQDIYRYNTFRDVSGAGNGSPNTGTYVIFNIGETGVPEIDPVPPAGTSANFGINLQSRFEYINLQYDFPLYQSGNTFVVGNTIAADASTNSFVLADEDNRIVVGNITSISDTIPGWFTINPVQKVVDYLDFLPGGIGDIIYSSLTVPGALTVTPGGSQVYIKLRDDTSSISLSTLPGPTTPGNIFQLNEVDITVLAPANATAVANATNLQSSQTGVSASLTLLPTTVQTNNALISSLYGEPALWAASAPATATINGVSVTFNVASTDVGYVGYARAAQMAQVINAANIPNIVASTPTTLVLLLTDAAGGAITIVNGTSDINGVPFAGSHSGSGLALSTAASTASQIKFTAVDARAINFLDVVGTPIEDFGLVSVENGDKACGLYIANGLRTATSTVVANLSAMNALSPLIGDQAYVIDSNDGNGNNVGEWSLWLYNGVAWVETSNQDSSTVDAKSIEYILTSSNPANINIGSISTGRRVSLITVEVTIPFTGPDTLSIGYTVNNPSFPPPVPAGLMVTSMIDLTVAGTYTTQTDILFGVDTQQGDVMITGTYTNAGSVSGTAQIIVSYI